MRRPTKSLGLYIQMVGRSLRTIGGNIEASIAAGKSDAAVLDFAGNIDRHGPLDFIRPKETKARLVSCETCGTRNASAATKCWSCGATMLKLCPACLESIPKYHLDCPHCHHNMRIEIEPGEKAPKLLDTPSGAALIAAYKTGTAREGGWLPIVRAWQDATTQEVVAVAGDQQYKLGELFAGHARAARWLRPGPSGVDAILLPNGQSRTSARQISSSGAEMIIPIPAVAA